MRARATFGQIAAWLPQGFRKCDYDIHKFWRAGLLLIVSVVFSGSCFSQVAGFDEYTLVGYNNQAVDNRVFALSEKLERGEVQLHFDGNRGYLDSLLAALDIDIHSQLLVFSKTSLQYPLIDGGHPRAVYFNDDTYIGWVQNSTIVEVMTMDAKLGAVFYIFHNINKQPQPFERQSQRCLVCHDSNGATGGGIPQLLAQSSVYSIDDQALLTVDGETNITDKTPLEKRWGGWYVSGLSGRQQHLGNVQLQGPQELPRLQQLLRGNLPTLAGQGLFDTAPYAVATSDIAAFMVLEHQLTVQNQLTYVRFKAPSVLTRSNQSEAITAASWAALPERAQRMLTRMLDEAVKLLLFTDATTFSDRIVASDEFRAGFLARGPHDGSGRSLRQFDLQRQLFRYPLSYLIYSSSFETLPAYAKDYIYQQLAAILQGRKQDAAFTHLTVEQRNDIIAILRATKPEFAAYLL